MCPRIASTILASASSRASPVDTHPGRSGAHTLSEASPAGSIRTVESTLSSAHFTAQYTAESWSSESGSNV